MSRQKLCKSRSETLEGKKPSFLMFETILTEASFLRVCALVSTMRSCFPLLSSPTPAFNRKGLEYDASADMYSYGILLSEIATQKKPYGDMSKAGLTGKIMHGLRPEVPLSDFPEMFLEMRTIMKDCWSASPKQRPTSDDVTFRIKSMMMSASKAQSAMVAPTATEKNIGQKDDEITKESSLTHISISQRGLGALEEADRPCDECLTKNAVFKCRDCKSSLVTSFRKRNYCSLSYHSHGPVAALLFVHVEKAARTRP